MKNTIYLILCLALAISCNRPQRVTSPINSETPKALQEENILEDVGSFSKRGKGDLLDELYSEQVSKRPELKEIENLLEKNKEEQVEALNDFESYNGKNQDYYNTANRHLDNIADSLLKEKMLAVINESSIKYGNKSVRLDVVVGQIQKQSLTITDYREALKIIVTIPIIAKYQDDNLPNDSLYRRIIREQKELIGRMGKKIENVGKLHK